MEGLVVELPTSEAIWYCGVTDGVEGLASDQDGLHFFINRRKESSLIAELRCFPSVLSVQVRVFPTLPSRLRGSSVCTI